MTSPVADISSVLEDEVPYITAWSGEPSLPAHLVLAPGGGIALRWENDDDRDGFGVLWAGCAAGPERGTPEYGRVHPRRQRECMVGLLCQVCGRPADMSERGWLWLLDTTGLDEPFPAEGSRTTNPPVCRDCAAKAALRCPVLRRGHVLVRVRRPMVMGVHGQVYRASGLGCATDRCVVPVGEKEFVSYWDGRWAWTLAGQVYAHLHGITPVPAAELTVAAEAS
ncbi:hypothetical protein [Streptomyces luteireticuli]|uniref:hypothetical protein n=1 Tax=Streptomyces luteireticuli TaxID=173858 RepID=UPI003556B1CE